MPYLPKVTLLAPLKDRSVLIFSGLFTLVYLLIQAYLLNSNLVMETVEGRFPFSYKLTLLFQLFTGYFAMFPLTQTLFIIASALLVGINLTLIISLSRANQFGVASVSSGAGLLAMVGAGCSGCGLTILSFLGTGSGVLGLVIHSAFLQVVITGILFFSIIYNLKKIELNKSCRILLK